MAYNACYSAVSFMVLSSSESKEILKLEHVDKLIYNMTTKT